MSTADLGEISSPDLTATYDRGFSLLKDATLRENKHDFAEAKKLYVDGCAVFMQLKEVEKDPQKKETIRKNLSEFLSAAERVDKKLKADSPKMSTDFHGESGGTAEIGERPTEFIRPGARTKGEKLIVEGELQRNIAFKDTEMGEGMQGDDPEIEIVVRKNSRWRYGLLVFTILLLVSVVIISVVLTRGGDSTKNEESSAMSTGWRFEIGMEISGFDDDLTISEVEAQISPSLEVVELELDLDNSETLSLELVEEISEGTYTVCYHLFSQIIGNADIYKTYIKDNRDIIEANILEAIFGSSANENQTIAIADTDSGLVIVAITVSPTELPTKTPSNMQTSVPTGIPTTSMPTIFPTNSPTAIPSPSPTVVGPLYHTINWATSLCCLLESQIESTVASVASVLSVSTDRIDVGSYSTARRRSNSETASTWNINYQIYTYMTDDPNLHTDLITNLENDSVLDAIGDHITSNINATISSIQTISLSTEVNDKDGNGDLLSIILYATAGGIASGVFCYCAYKCRRCSKN